MTAPRAALAAPTPLAPVEGAAVPPDTATFRWSAAPGSGPFTLRVAAASAPDAPLVEVDGLASSEATLADALPTGPAVWWVKAEGGPWSRAARCVVGTPADQAAPTAATATPKAAPKKPTATPPRPARSAATTGPLPTSPVEGAVEPLDAVTFEWSAPPGASSFGLRVAAARAPEDTIVELDDLPTTVASIAAALPAGEMVWQVRQGGGRWSAPAHFTAGTLADVEVAQKEAAAEARREEVAAREAKLLGEPEPLPEAPPEPVWPHVEGDALDGAPAVDWSTVRGFEAPTLSREATSEAEPPVLQGPLGGEVVDAVAVELRWSPVPGAVGYDVELSPHESFDRDVLTLDAGATTAVTLPGIVPAVGHRLLWRVRARTAAGTTAWSPYGRFYPAPDAAVDQFRQSLDAALAAARKRRDYERMVYEREMALVPPHERDDATADSATLVVLLGVMSSGIVIALAVALFSLFRF